MTRNSQLTVVFIDIVKTSCHQAMISLNPDCKVLVITGLAGVYDISKHYDYEALRGVEDISTMARAMYGLKQFERFSPTCIIHSLPASTRFESDITTLQTQIDIHQG